MQVGTGGTGSYLARQVARLASLLRTQGRDVSVMLVDPDIVESANVARQDFSQAEIGLPKARVLALRYSAAFGIEIQTVIARFHPKMVARILSSWWETLIILCAAVDNAAARTSLAEALHLAGQRSAEVPRVWWLDCGNNTRDAGQVLLGSTNAVPDLVDAFALPGYCRKLPSPALQHPELLVPLPEEQEGNQLSCEQLLAANTQSLVINQFVAAHAAAMLSELLITQRLRRFATYFALESGIATSKYITPLCMARVIDQDPAFFRR